MSKFELPKLEGWATIAEVAGALKVSRQAVHKMLETSVLAPGEACQVGSDIKPIYLISRMAIFRLLLERETH